MLDEPAGPRSARGDALREALREDLEIYAVADLEERIADLEAEIVRTRAQLDKKRDGRSAADAMFKL